MHFPPLLSPTLGFEALRDRISIPAQHHRPLSRKLHQHPLSCPISGKPNFGGENGRESSRVVSVRGRHQKVGFDGVHGASGGQFGVDIGRVRRAGERGADQDGE